MNLSKKLLLLVLPLFISTIEVKPMATSGITTQEVGKMNAGDFKQAVQDIADGFANGAQFDLEDSMRVSVDPIERMIANLPGPFVKFFSSIKFKRDLKLLVDYDKQVVVISGKYDLPFLKSQGDLFGVVRMSRNLMDDNTAKKSVVGSKKKGLTKDAAQKLVAQGMQTLLSGLFQSTILGLGADIKPSKLMEALGDSKIPGHDEFKKIGPKLKILDDILEGDMALAFTSQSYYDPFEGYLQARGLNLIGNFNIARKWTNKLTKTLMEKIGASPDVSKGLRATVVIPKAILGMSLTVSLPGQLKWGIPGGKVLAETTRLALTTTIGGSGLSAGFLEEQLKGGLLLYLPWQKKPLEVDIVFSLDSATNVGMKGFIKDLKLPELPLELENAFLEAKINLAEFVKLIVDTIAYVISSVGEQAVEVGSVGVTTVATEGAEVAETAEEAEDATKLIMPLSEFGIGFDVNIIGRKIKGAFCFEYDPDEQKFGFILMAELARGPARPEALKFFMGDKDIKPDPKSFIGIKDLWLLYYEIQRKALKNIDSMAELAHLKPMAKLLEKMLDAQKTLTDDFIQYFPDFALETAYIYIAPLSMRCGNQPYSSGIEIEASGKIMGVELEGDLVLNIFGLINLLKAIGSKVGGSKDGKDKAQPTSKVDQWKSQIKDSVTTKLKDTGSKAGGKIKDALGIAKDTKDKVEPAKPGTMDTLKSVGGTAGSVVGVGAGLLGPLVKGLLGGVYARLAMGKVDVGPLHISSDDGKRGPLFWFNLGFAYPKGPALEKKDIGGSFLIGSLLDGKVKLDVPPGMEGGLLGKLTIGGFDIMAHGKMGAFDALLDGGIHLNPLKDHLTIELLNLDQIAKELDAEIHNVINTAGKGVQKGLSAAQKGITQLQDQLGKAQDQIHTYHRAMDECAKNNPPAQALNYIQGQIERFIKNNIKPGQVLQQMTQFTDLGFDAKMLGTIRRKVKDALKSKATNKQNPLSYVSGLSGALR